MRRWGSTSNINQNRDARSSSSQRGPRSFRQILLGSQLLISSLWQRVLMALASNGIRRLRRSPSAVLIVSTFGCLFFYSLLVDVGHPYPSTIRGTLGRSKDTPSTLSSAASFSSYWTKTSWTRIRPRSEGTVYGEKDDFRVGKSCHWRKGSQFFRLLGKRYYWDCRDCGTFTEDWNMCQSLKRRHKCSSFSFQDWDGPRSRSASTYDPGASLPHPVRLVTSYGVGKVRKVEYEQAQCPLGLKGPCWDLGRCTDKNGTLQIPIPIYAYPGIAKEEFDAAMEILLGGEEAEGRPSSILESRHIQSTQNPNEACLLMVHNNNIEVALTSPSWNGGRNHYVYGSIRPIGDYNYEMAALGSGVATNAQIRLGYDIPLPLPALWQPPEKKESTTTVGAAAATSTLDDLHRPRRLLLSFRGSIQDTLQPYYQHRWLAAEYLHGEPLVEINVQCKHKTWRGDRTITAAYDTLEEDGASTFDDLMLNSTFGFCPGGSHVTSFRFTEVLSAGGIPVILPEIVPPLVPELDWTGCVVTVSQARIVDLPRILAGMSEQDIHIRQRECHRLYQFIRNEPGKPMALTTPLRLWTTRLKQAVSNVKQQKDFSNKS